MEPETMKKQIRSGQHRECCMEQSLEREGAGPQNAVITIHLAPAWHRSRSQSRIPTLRLHLPANDARAIVSLATSQWSGV